MDMMTFIQYTIAILELVFFILTIFYLIKGLKTNDYKNLKKYGSIYFRKVSSYIQTRAVAVSIIGGADGPTSIFLAGKVAFIKRKRYEA